MTRRWPISAGLISVLGLNGSVNAGTGRMEYKVHEIPGCLRVEMPRGWVIRQDALTGLKDGACGLTAVSPPGDGKSSLAVISADLYKPGNIYFASAQELLDHYRKVEEHFRIQGGRASIPIKEETYGKRRVRFFSRKASAGTRAGKVERTKGYAVIEGPAGFFLLTISVPSGSFERFRVFFDRLKISVEPA